MGLIYSWMISSEDRVNLRTEDGQDSGETRKGAEGATRDGITSIAWKLSGKRTESREELVTAFIVLF